MNTLLLHSSSEVPKPHLSNWTQKNTRRWAAHVGTATHSSPKSQASERGEGPLGSLWLREARESICCLFWGVCNMHVSREVGVALRPVPATYRAASDVCRHDFRTEHWDRSYRGSCLPCWDAC